MEATAKCSLVRLEKRLDGQLRLSKHHMIFQSPAGGHQPREIWICYPIINELARPNGLKAIRVFCKDFMFVRFEFESEKECANIFTRLEESIAFASIRNLYAFVYAPANPEKGFNGWSLYKDVRQEYTRMGLDWSKWRISEANSSYGLCPTYPASLVVPSDMSDNVLAHASKFRSKGRLPVLTYYHSLNGCTISRCSQPLVGMRQNRNMQDERLVHAILGTTDPPSGTRGASTDNAIIDLRPSTNAFAQTALGGGTENMDRYRNARKIYLGIDNLHVMRDSLKYVTDALRHSDTSPAPPSPASLERSNWLGHINLILEGTRQIVQQVHVKCSHVVVHCSDGWDRTPQLTSLAMLLLDPYYRTLDGIIVLIEKEWLSFGHQFLTRNGAIAKRVVNDASEDTTLLSNVTSFIADSTRNRQTGPIFHQWLDCVYQLVYAFPNRFEFNERFLRRLLYHSYACQYGTFLYDSERDRYDGRASSQTRSVWDYFLARREQFVNHQYEKHEQVFLPPNSARWWAAAFGRADKDMNDPEAWRQYAMRPVPQLDVPQSDVPSAPSPNLSASVALDSNRSRGSSRGSSHGSEPTPESNEEDTKDPAIEKLSLHSEGVCS